MTESNCCLLPHECGNPHFAIAFPVLAVKLTELARRQEFPRKNTEVLAFPIQTKKEAISKYFTTGRRMSLN